MATRHSLLTTLVLSASLPSSLALPAGFTTWFIAPNATATCSDIPGWIEFSSARGRVVVSVTTPNASLMTVGQALSDREDRIHSHAYSGSVVLASKHVAAIDCCNNDGASEGTYPIAGQSNPAVSGLPFAQLLLCSLVEEDDTLSVPFGSVAYFPNASTGCPDEWSPYLQVQGRTLVPQNIPQGDEPILSSDAPLALGEDRVHTHSVSSAVDVPDIDFVGVDGCCNDNPTASGSIPFESSMDSGSAGVPYLTSLTCMSNVATFNTSLPVPAMYFNPTLNCQNGYVQASWLAGRFLVGLPLGAQANAVWGASPLTANDTAASGTQHTFSGSLPLPSTGVGLATGCCADGYGAAGTVWYAGTSSSTEAGFPFMQLPLCMSPAAMSP